MIRPLIKYIIPFIAVFVAIGILLFCFHPLAPLLLVLSVLIQAPLVWYYIRSAYAKSSKDKEKTRKCQFEQDGDAEAWLALEEQDAKSVTFRYWPRASRDGNVLNRVELLIRLEKIPEAQELVDTLEQKKLSVPNLTRCLDIMRQIEAAGQSPAADS